MASPCSRLPLALAFASSLAAQALQQGYDSRVQPLPANATNVLRLDRDRVAWFDGAALLLQEGSAPPRPLLQVAATFGAFLIAAGPARLLLGDSGNGDLWLVPLHGGQPRLVANLPLCYDAVMLAPGRVLVSAKTGGYAAGDNDLVAVDLGSGAPQHIGSVAGASGPLAVSARGDVYYATASNSFPPPAGGAAILRWDASQVQQALRGGPPLTAAVARTLATGIDTAADLALDGDGDLLFVDWWRGTVGEISDLDGASPARTELLEYLAASVSAVTLQFEAGTRGAFEPFQPASGGTLWVHESSFGAQSQLRAIAPARPRLQASAPSPIPAGPFDLTTTLGPAMGFGVLFLGPVSGLHEWQLRLPGFEQPLWWSTGMMWPLAVRLGAFDAAGSMPLTLDNPGFAGHGASFVAQVLAFDLAPPVLGSSPPLRLRLGL